MLIYFLFFFVSGFCSILYELIWLRLAMAQFSVTTPLVSIVLSTFMAGLGIGSVTAGRWARRQEQKTIRIPPLRLYALAEVLIGVSALAVPTELAWGHRFLEAAAIHAPISSGQFYLLAGAWLIVTLVPWCACMGATIPLAMVAIRNHAGYASRHSFSFLYLANVLGATAGAVLPLLLIELYGFRGTLRLGALLNVTIATTAFVSASVSGRRAESTAIKPQPAISADSEGSKSTLVLLFMTGFVTMAMELVWIRLFTPYLGAIVYSFAAILACYLMATFAGSHIYRWWSRFYSRENRLTWILLAPLGVLPLLSADSRLRMFTVLRVLLGIVPVSALIGFLTPMLVDRWSAGNADRAGRAYAVNVLGCILGPLISGFILLPWAGEHLTLLLLVVPWFAMALPVRSQRVMSLRARAATLLILFSAVAVFYFTKGYETSFANREVLRDSTATVIAAEVPTSTGVKKRLLVNGVGMTALGPTTKMMAHFPLASLAHPPQQMLVICFGMGTTFRSGLSWGIPVTSVDLVPSVPKMFHYFHPDAGQVLSSAFAHVVVDDGRRYLERVPTRYDVIVIDPPPPVEAAGSSLLYSQEFYAVAKERLQPRGIVAQWLPEGDEVLQASIARAIKNSFPYVRVFHSVRGVGWHFLASDSPLETWSAAELVARMPKTAVADMMEWGPGKTPEEQFNLMLSSEMTPDQMIAQAPGTPALQDDRPINEYFLLRTPEANLRSRFIVQR